MGDPLSEIAKQVGKTVLDGAVQAGKAYIAEAERAQRNTAEACVAYLRAANAALDGLMGEYDSIVTEAGACNVTNVAQRRHLRVRIAAYLREYPLTQVLKDATRGIETCLAILADNPAGFLRLNPRRTIRQQAVENLYAALTGLRDYLIQIEEQGLRHRIAGTGIGAMQLNEMERLLADDRAAATGSQGRLLELVSNAIIDPQRLRFERSKPNIQGVIVQLNAAFV